MIEQLRIDERLIHGQVALVWSKELNTQHNIVFNDKAATDQATSVTLQMALPAGQKLLVRSMDQAEELLRNPKVGQTRIFALVTNVSDALRLVKSSRTEIKEVNLANCGRFDGSPVESKKKLTRNIMLSPEELAAAEELCEIDIPFFCQVIPDDPKVPVRKLLEAEK